MGACDFTVKAFGKDIKDAFKNAVEEALYENGHDSYNGTISTTQLVRDVTKEFPRYGTKAFWEKFDEARHTVPKWDCHAIELTGKALKEFRAKHGLARKRIRVFLFFGTAAC
jgi:hypothetical protein